MRIALFLDVDGVLTHEPVNLQIARLLRVEEELLAVETEWMSGMTNEEFNEKLIPLFMRNGFSPEFVAERYEDIRLRLHAPDLLRVAADVYLVSSGPSYYIEVLASRHGIDPNRVLCSRYEWSGRDGRTLRCTAPVNDQLKADFVSAQMRKGRYDLAIGVGDNPSQDSAFLSHCDVRVLVHGFQPGFLCAQDPSAVLSLIRAVYRGRDGSMSSAAKRLRSQFSDTRTIFIMTPFRFEDPSMAAAVEAIEEALVELGFTALIASKYSVAEDVWGNICAGMYACEAGIALFVNCDESGVVADGLTRHNPNVAMEVGFMRALGKPLLLLKDQQVGPLPADLLGTLYEEFDIRDARGTVPGRVAAFAKILRRDSGEAD